MSPQALTLMNSDAATDRSIAFAMRIQKDALGTAEQVRRALRELDLVAGMRVISASHLYGNPPMGPQDQPDYVNAVDLAAVNGKPVANPLFFAVDENTSYDSSLPGNMTSSSNRSGGDLASFRSPSLASPAQSSDMPN